MTLDAPSPANRPLPPLTLINGPRQLKRMLERLHGQPAVAIDTEANSLHAYQEQVCLIQLSVPEADYIVDPLSEQFAFAPETFAPFGELLADPAVQKIFHAAEYDLIGLKRDFGFQVANLFDTMQAARVMGWPQVGLGSLLEKFFGIVLDKRLQRADWAQRPLSPDLLGYARLDTRYLIDLRDVMIGELTRAGRLAEAQEDFRRLEHVEGNGRVFDPEGYRRIGRSNELSPRQLAALRELYLFRNEQAKRLNRPPFKVMGDQTLIALALQMPAAANDLRAAEMSPHQIRRFGAGVLAALERAHHAPVPGAAAARARPDDAVLARYEALRAWRKERAKQRGVESDVILPRDVVWALARKPPRTLEELDQIADLGPWRRQEYGEEILKVLAKVR